MRLSPGVRNLPPGSTIPMVPAEVAADGEPSRSDALSSNLRTTLPDYRKETQETCT